MRVSLGTINSPSGAVSNIPCLAVRGAEDGPTLVLSGATHGNEIVGTGAIIRLMQAIDPLKVKGMVIGIPVANVPAFDSGEYRTPQDGGNMASRIYWNSNRQGTVTARMGAALGAVYEMADCYIDIHGNRGPSAPMAMMFLSSAPNDEVRKSVQVIGEAFGLTPVDMSHPVAHPGWFGPVNQYPAPVATENGIPSLLIELMTSHSVLDAERGRKGIMNVMRTLGMIDGDLEAQDSPRLPGNYRYWGSVNSNNAGLVWPLVQPGVLLSKGDPIADISNLYGDVIESICAPADGFLWSLNGAHYGGRTLALPEGSDICFFAERVS